MTEHEPISWDNLLEGLGLWHQQRDETLGRAVFAFLECELRWMTPPIARRLWSEEDLEDALHDFLLRLLKKPLQGSVREPKAYLRRMFHNHHTRRHKTEQRGASAEDEVDWWDEQEASGLSPLAQTLRDEQREQLSIQFAKLQITDRVVFKLAGAPYWLSDDEVEWLAQRSGLSVADVRETIRTAGGDMYTLSKIYNPGDDDPEDSTQRRTRMETFRKQRARARDRLRNLFREGDQ